MNRILLLLAACFALAFAAPAVAQDEGQNAARSDGGLHVSGGGTFGYIGGSGSPQGEIRGPGSGGGGAPAAPAAEAPAPAPQDVAPAEPAPAEEHAEPASSGARMGPVSWAVAAVMALGGFWLYRKLPAPR